MLIGLLFTLYVYLLAFLFFTTVLLIAFDLSWGSIPHLYIRILERIQEEFQKAYPSDYFEQLPWRSLLVEKKPLNDCNDRHNDFEFIDQHVEFPYNTNLNLIRSGIEAIVQDEFCGSFDLAPEHQRYRLNRILWDFLDNKLHLKILFVLLILLRVFVIFPVRLCLYLSSFLFITGCCFLTYFVKFSTEQKLFINRRFCRLYTAGTGLIAFFHNEQDKPMPPGIIVSNHLTANDVMVICSDVGSNQDWLYTVTGQQHSGVIGYIQMLVSKLCSTMWLERSIADSRLKFLKSVLEAARQKHIVLMFPEGYCTNNTSVLQFRKAVFEKDIRIHPVAIRQDARFGDAFWYEDWFIMHLVRVISSFATIYHITYLPPQHRWEDESPEQFAMRVQNLIAKTSECRSMQFQGTLFYKSHEREKFKHHLQKLCSAEIYRLASETPAPYNTSASD